MTRRDLVQKILIGGTTLMIFPSALNSCSKDEDNGNGGTGGKKITIDLTVGTYAVLNNPGGTAIIQGIIAANTGTGYVALDSICTHQGCTVSYDSASNNFPCPCHGSVFSATGSVVNGPATTALKSYPVSKSGNILTISL